MLWGPNSCRISPGRQQEGERSSWNPGAPAPRASLVSSWPGQELSMSTRVSEGIFPRGGISYDCVFCSFPTWFSWAGWGEAFLGKSSKAAAFPGGSWAFLTSCWEHFGNVFWVGKVLSPLQVLIPALCSFPWSGLISLSSPFSLHSVSHIWDLSPRGALTVWDFALSRPGVVWRRMLEEKME